MQKCYSVPCRWYVGGPVGRIRYYRASAGARLLVGPNAFLPLEYYEVADLGGDDGGTGPVFGAAQEYDRGTNHRPELLGDHPAGSAADFAGESPLPEVVTPPECLSQPPVGVFQLVESPYGPRVPGAGMWWAPRGLERYAVGERAGFWRDDTGNGHDGTEGGLPVHWPLRVVGPAGLPAALFDSLTNIPFRPLPTANHFTAYAVAVELTEGLQRGQPQWQSSTAEGGQGILLTGAGIAYYNQQAVGTGATFAVNSVNLWAWRRDGQRVRLYHNGTVLLDTTLTLVGGPLAIDGCALSALLSPHTGQALLSEWVCYPRSLSDLEFQWQSDSLTAKYFIGDTGALELDPGDALYLHPGDPLILR